MRRYREELAVAAYLSGLTPDLSSQIRGQILGAYFTPSLESAFARVLHLPWLLVVAVLAEEEVEDGPMAEAVLHVSTVVVQPHIRSLLGKAWKTRLDTGFYRGTKYTYSCSYYKCITSDTFSGGIRPVSSVQRDSVFYCYGITCHCFQFGYLWFISLYG